MSACKLTDGVYWVGAIDRDIPPSSGYTGTSYNAYLIIDEKITLVDGVKFSHQDQMWANIKEIVEPEKIDYIIVNHVEPDHASSMKEMVETIKPEKIYCSKPGRDTIVRHFHNEEWPFEIVKKNDEISLGKRTVQFMMTRMLHWPDSMFSFLKEDGILFSNDAFGQHLADERRFDDEVEISYPIQGAGFFYATNLNLLSLKVKKIMQKLQAMDWELKMIAPDHGFIWRSHIDKIFEAYEHWSNQRHHKEALVVFDTKWKSTATMAQAIAKGIEENDVPVTMCSLKEWKLTAIAEKLLTASTIVIGSPTLNNGVSPAVAALLQYLKGLRSRNKIAGSFGSYGWGGEAVPQINEVLDEIKMQRVGDGVRIQYVPNQDQLKECEEYGKRIAQETLAYEI